VSDLSHDSPGVQGLAQLGRNAIDRVSELERGIAYRDQMIRQLSEELDDAKRAETSLRPLYAAPPIPRVDPEWLAGVIRLHSPHDAVYALAEKIAEAINGRAK